MLTEIHKMPSFEQEEIENRPTTSKITEIIIKINTLIVKTQLLWTQCRGMGPHLAGQGKSHGFSRVAAGTWGIFSSYSGDVHSKL